MQDKMPRDVTNLEESLLPKFESPRAHPIQKVLEFTRNIVSLRAQTDSSTGVTSGRRPNWTIISFIGFVIAPSFLAAVYLAFIASDQFVAEARFAVRVAEMESLADKAASSLSPITGGSMTIFSSSTQNAYIVASYIKSRAMIDDLLPTLDLREIYRRPEADFVAKLTKTATLEQLLDYWLRMVDCYVDGPSGIVKLQVRAFRQGDAVVVAEAVLKLSEKLINDLSIRAHADAMRMSEQEVRRSDGLVREALVGLRSYRDTEGMIDPVKAADETGKLLAGLLTEKIRIEGDLFVARRTLSNNSPSVQNLTNRLDSVDIQITELKAKLTGNSATVRNVASSLLRFEELELQRQFAEKLYKIAQDSMERARVVAERKSIYLVVFAPPSRPEDAAYPRRLGYSLVIPIILTIFWSIGALILASIEDHRL